MANIMKEPERQLVAEAVISRWATGDDNSFISAYDDVEQPSLLSSADEAVKFVEKFDEVINYVHDHLVDIIADYIFRTESFEHPPFKAKPFEYKEG